jgi:hypothetical protein
MQAFPGQVSEIMPTPQPRRIATGPRVGGRETKLEQIGAQQYSQLLGYVRAGAFREQAAKVLGVTPSTFATWLRRGLEDLQAGQITSFSKLAVDILKAEGEARIVAEIEIKQNNPLAWLRHAGRNKPDEPGWSEEKTILHTGDDNHPITIDSTSLDKITAMRQALEVLTGLGMNPAALLEQRPSSVYDAPALPAPQPDGSDSED